MNEELNITRSVGRLSVSICLLCGVLGIARAAYCLARPRSVDEIRSSRCRYRYI